MNYINICGIHGLFNEFYRPNDFSYISTLTNKEKFYNVNDIFWNWLLSDDFISNFLSSIHEEVNSLSIWEQAIFSNIPLFHSEIKNSFKIIVEQNSDIKEFYSAIETLTIYCNLLSKYFFPYKLSIQEGFELSDFSFEKIVEDSSNDTVVLDFLNKHIFGYEDNIDLVFHNGNINFSSILIIKYIKKRNPNCLVFLKNHSSEYFSLNKITDLILKNKLLFSYIDGIVLDDSPTTVKEIIQCFESNISFSSVANIIYKDESEIKLSFYKQHKLYPSDTISKRNTSKIFNNSKGDKIVNMRLFPNKICYWRKCTFCAINAKYQFNETMFNDDLKDTIIEIIKLNNLGIKYFWFEDEAISKDNLLAFSNSVLNLNLEIIWQVRTRFDAKFTLEDAKKLYSAGLREIRMGLESGSKRVLKLMNKYDFDDPISIIINQVKILSVAGIHVHIPCIIGFPGETLQDRNNTYSLLEYLYNNYNISFNINRLYLDIGSKLFKDYYLYNISGVKFKTKPYDNLSNYVDFDYYLNDIAKLDNERNEFMKKFLYPWLPDTTITPPIVLYRLSEAIRNTLIWNSFIYHVGKKNKGCLKLCNRVVYFTTNNNSVILYNWKNHEIITFENNVFIQFINFINGKDNKLDHKYLDFLLNKEVIFYE